MNRKSLGGLIVLNVFLLVLLGVLSFTPQPADAQLRRAGDYVMVAGAQPGQTTDAIYVADLNNAALLAVSYDQSRRELRILGGRDISGDFAAGGGR